MVKVLPVSADKLSEGLKRLQEAVGREQNALALGKESHGECC